MHQRPFLSGGWTRGGASEVVRRAHPASGAQWNVQVVRGKVNGKCLWNACKALSLGLLLMVLGAAMATIGYYADHLSIAQEVRGNHTVRIKNESRGFHLNNLSYAGPIVMGVGGFIVVAACVMTFEARDSAAKVVPARLKLSTSGPPPSGGGGGHQGTHSHHGSLRTSGSQTGSFHQHPPTHHHHHHHHHHHRTTTATTTTTASTATAATITTDRKALTESFMNFSKGLQLKNQISKNVLKIPQNSINKSPSAPDLVAQQLNSQKEQSSLLNKTGIENRCPKFSRPLANCALLNAGMLHRHALSVDETAANYRHSHDSFQDNDSQNSLALDLHLDCPVTLRVHDRRRNPLLRQRRVDEDERPVYEDTSRRSSHSCSPRVPLPHKDSKLGSGGSAQQLSMHPSTYYCSSITSAPPSRRRSSNASDSTHRSRSRKRDCPHNSRGRLERAISSDSRLIGAIPRTSSIHYQHHRHHRYHQHCNSGSPTQNSSMEQEPIVSCSDTDIRKATNTVQFCTYRH